MCHPELIDLGRKLISACRGQGLIIGIGECYRTVEEQNSLYEKGRSKPGKIVTNARGNSYSSHHQWGTAFDVYRNDGKGAYNDYDGFFSKVGKIGKSLGLEWGGEWESPVDKPHFQLPYWGSTTKKLKELYKTPDEFIKSWKEEKEVVENSYIEVDGKQIPIRRILKNNTNYIAVRDLAAAVGDKVSSKGNTAVLNKAE